MSTVVEQQTTHEINKQYNITRMPFYKKCNPAHLSQEITCFYIGKTAGINVHMYISLLVGSLHQWTGLVDLHHKSLL